MPRGLGIGVLVVAYPGLGDACMSYPILWSLAHDQRFADATIAYPSTPLFRNLPRLGLPPLPSTVVTFEKRWYAFEECDWDDITAYLRQHKIDLVINLQNEGPRYDKNYYLFKDAHPGEYWELDFDTIYSGREHVHILDSTRRMLADHDVHWWYPPRRAEAARAGTAIYVGASEPNKRWDTNNWVAVMHELAAAYPSQSFSVLTGHSPAELREASRMQHALRAYRNVDVKIATSLEENLSRLSRAQLLVSHDTYPVHLASLLAIPAIGVYLATDPIVWGSYENPSTYLWSALDCGGRKQGTGNCIHFHTACPNIQEMRNAIRSDQVLQATRGILDGVIAQRAGA